MAEEEQASAEKRISIIKIYTKDLSFESPRSPAVFTTTDWQPETNLNLRSTHSQIEDNIHEVVLTITIEAKEKGGDKTLFLMEIQQAGLFELAGYGDEEMQALIGSFTPNILFPYARESIASCIQKGGFPEFVLQPINFDALYMQSLQQKAASEAASSGETH